jgi:hypothetical protein
MFQFQLFTLFSHDNSERLNLKKKKLFDFIEICNSIILSFLKIMIIEFLSQGAEVKYLEVGDPIIFLSGILICLLSIITRWIFHFSSWKIVIALQIALLFICLN